LTKLTNDQLELLRDFEHHGGALIVRPPADIAAYTHLVKVGYVLAQAINHATRYEITERGRAALRSFNY
jgi:hypothetical protein